MIGERKELNYPPFYRFAKIVFSGSNKVAVDKIANDVRNNFTIKFKGLQILGPAWCFREKLRNQFRMQIVFKSSKEIDPNGIRLRKYIKDNIMSKNIGKGVKLSIDIDPVSLL